MRVDCSAQFRWLPLQLWCRNYGASYLLSGWKKIQGHQVCKVFVVLAIATLSQSVWIIFVCDTDISRFSWKSGSPVCSASVRSVSHTLHVVFVTCGRFATYLTDRLYWWHRFIPGGSFEWYVGTAFLVPQSSIAQKLRGYAQEASTSVKFLVRYSSFMAV